VITLQETSHSTAVTMPSPYCQAGCISFTKPLSGQFTCAVGVSSAKAAAGTCQEAVLVDGALGAANVGGVLSGHTAADCDVYGLRQEVGVVRGGHLHSPSVLMVSCATVRLQKSWIRFGHRVAECRPYCRVAQFCKQSQNTHARTQARMHARTHTCLARLLSIC
jgi:hypothetical protein